MDWGVPLFWWCAGVASAIPVAWVGVHVWARIAPWIMFVGVISDLPPPDPRLPPLTLDEVRNLPRVR